jgi:1,4-alpha-glucan branching enzyme
VGRNSYIRNIYGGNDFARDIPDGWRLLHTITADKNARQPWKVYIAEDMQDVDSITRPTFAGGAGFDSQWDAAFVHPVRAVLTRLWTAPGAWTLCGRRWREAVKVHCVG